MVSKTFWFLVLSGLLLYSCVDEIQLNIDNVEQRIVIDGLIADSLDEYQIHVFKSAILGNGRDNIFDPITDAEVYVFDDEGNIFEFQENQPGYYVNEMQGIAGRTYYLEVKTTDEKLIRSKPSVLTKSPKIEKITPEVKDKSFYNESGNEVKQTYVTLKVNTAFEEEEEKPFLRWES